MTPSKIRVLVVDDSAFARKVVREVLSQDPAIEVIATARDGFDALEKIAELDPDVVTLDLIMPELDGIGVLKALGKSTRARVIVVSVSGAETDLGLEAMDLGAVDIVAKPTAIATDRLYELSGELIFKVKAAAHAGAKFVRPIAEDSVATPLSTDVSSVRKDMRVVAIGTSTGGPQALTEVFRTLPADFPLPLVLALHIPSGYTETLAERLTALGGVAVVEARTGMKLQRGVAIIAPGGQHLTISAEGDDLVAHVSHEPIETLYHPSVNLLFQSLADSVGGQTIGVILTGMGDDGFLGSKSIHEKGGLVMVEAESTSIVYGMPRVVAESGIADAQVPLEQISQLLCRAIGHRQS